jgi:hypothetical protein
LPAVSTQSAIGIPHLTDRNEQQLQGASSTDYWRLITGN